MKEITIHTSGQGLYEFTDQIAAAVKLSNVENGLATIFVRHTSASLTIQENADPSAQNDLENWLRRLVPEGDPLFTHTAEGPDDMPSHIKAALTATSLGIPVHRGRLVLGTWQGVFLWEHRRAPHRRKIVVHFLSNSE